MIAEVGDALRFVGAEIEDGGRQHRAHQLSTLRLEPHLARSDAVLVRGLLGGAGLNAARECTSGTASDERTGALDGGQRPWRTGWSDTGSHGWHRAVRLSSLLAHDANDGVLSPERATDLARALLGHEPIERPP